MEAGFIFIADRHPGSDGLTHFHDDPDQEPGSASFKLNGVAFTRPGRRRSARRSAFVKNVHNYCYPRKGVAATRVFLAAIGKTPALGLETQATEERAAAQPAAWRRHHILRRGRRSHWQANFTFRVQFQLAPSNSTFGFEGIDLIESDSSFHRAKLAQGDEGINPGQQKMRPVILPALPEGL
jgi:hypothetical protein